MSIITVVSRLDRRWLMRRTKQELASIILANIDHIDVFRGEQHVDTRLLRNYIAEAISETRSCGSCANVANPGDQHCSACTDDADAVIGQIKRFCCDKGWPL